MENKIIVFGLLGESVFMEVDHFHKNGETIIANSIHKEIGGKGINQALACRTLTNKVTFIGCIGNDEYASYAKNYLKSKDLSFHLIEKEGNSAYATILTNKDGENEVTVYHGVNLLFNLNDVKKYEEDILNSHYVLIQGELPEEVIKEVISISKKGNTLVILNPAPAQDYLKKYLTDVWLITPNFQEACVLLNLNNNICLDELITSLKYSDIKRIVITLGKRGALLKDNDEISIIETEKVDRVLDTTGAGDIFNGVLVASLFNGFDFKTSCIKACHVATHSVKYKYVMPSIEHIGEAFNE